MKMSKFFPAAERRTSENGAETELERESIFPEQEIVDKVIEYYTSGNNVARLNMVERGNLTKEVFAQEVKEHVRKQYISNDKAVERIYQGFSSFMWGYYIIDGLIADPDISDIKIYDYNRIYIKKLGVRYKADISFRDRVDYERFIERCSLRNHISLSINNSTQKWTDWSDERYILRFTAITKLLASNRMTTIHMRKHPKHKKTMDVLIQEGLLTAEMASKFDNENIHNLVVLVKQLSETGSVAGLLSDIKKRLAKLQESYNSSERTRINRLIAVCTAAIACAGLAVLGYAFIIGIAASAKLLS